MRFKTQRSGKADFPGTHRLENAAERGRLLHFFANHELLATELMALTDATSKLDSTEATRALPVERPQRRPQTAVRAPTPARREQRQRKRNPLRAIVAALIVLLAGAAIALALSLSSSNKQDINNGNVHDQVRGLIQYINKHTQ